MERYRKETFPVQTTLGDQEDKLHQNSKNDIIKQTVSIWRKAVKKYKMERDIKILTWPALDHNFKPGTTDAKIIRAFRNK